MKKDHKSTVFHRIFIPLLIFGIIQAVLLYFVLVANGVFKNLDDNSFNLLEEYTLNKQQILANSMINNWSNFQSSSDIIENIINKELNKQNKSWDSIKTDAELNELLIKDVSSELLSRLRKNKTTGIFLILNGRGVKDEKDSYAGIYIRDNDPDTEVKDNSDLSLVRGLPPISRFMGLSLDSFWKSVFKFSEEEDNDFFFKPLNAAIDNNIKNSEYCGYWSHSFKFGDNKDISLITYSMPLINSEGLVYGVLGIEISDSYLKSILCNGHYFNIENYFYTIGITDKNKESFESICSSSDRKLNGSFKGEHIKKRNDDIIIESNLYNNKSKYYGSVYNLNLYNNNTPFFNEKWVLIGFQNENTLFKTKNDFKKIVIITIFLTMFIEIILSIIVSRRIVDPINKIANIINKSDENKKINLPHTGMYEVDLLVDSITKMSIDTIESSKRTSKLIELSGLSVGVYELRTVINICYCSEGFFSILDCEDLNDGSNLIKPSQLNDILEKLYKNKVEEDLYLIKKGDKKIYLRSVSQQDENFKIGAIIDVTPEIEKRLKVEHERDYDILTGIWNRRAFEKKISNIFAYDKEKLKYAAIIMFDLDNLKGINDTYGHDSGDLYISNFANALGRCAKDNIIVARRSGDEFYALTYGYDSKENLKKNIELLWEYLSNQTVLLPDGTNYKIRVSGGISIYPDDADTAERLIHYADFAMYRVKHSQKGIIHEFDINEYNNDSFLFNSYEDFNKIIEEQQVRFMFQPIISVKDSNIYGYELLMRSDIDKLRTPDLIIKMAKSQGKLHNIEKITWFKGLSDASDLIKKGVIGSDKALFINSIANQMLDEEDRKEIIRLYKDIIPNIVLEVTEGEDNNMEFTNDKLAFVRSFNGKIAIDDYGSGYNSEMALVMIPSNIVKIDMLFVRDIDSDKDKQVIIKNLIRYARQKNIEVLAEGVETYKEMETLISFGVDYLQGFYIARPNYVPENMKKTVKDEINSLYNKYKS